MIFNHLRVIAVVFSIYIPLGVSGCNGIIPEKPQPVIASTHHDYKAFGDSDMIVTVRNVGGDGKIKVAVSAYRDKNSTQLINTWSTIVFLRKGEEKTVTIQLKNLSEGTGVFTNTTATVEP